MKPVQGPWGGSNAFVTQMTSWLKRRGYSISYDLRRPVDAIVLVDPRTDNRYKTFGLDAITDYKRIYPSTPVLHRINECDQRKGTQFMDPLLAQANQSADYTIFIAEWLRDYHAQRWFDSNRPHCCIYNGADSSVFHPIGSRLWHPGEPFRIVTHHWSNHERKGFDVYQQLDELLAANELKDVEFRLIGRWPESIQWKKTFTMSPATGVQLANQLRECHTYLTASRWEPCGMHHVEGAQCGLPLLYHEDGGGIVEAGKRYGVSFRENISTAIHQCRENYKELRAQVLKQMPDGDVMCMAYERILCQLIVHQRESLASP
jgi:glycosyltransferase involved in cell wall biosynthesis